MHIRRFERNPIITPAMIAPDETNVNGPSLVRAPQWLDNPLGVYYLYFAHHQGRHIRLAFADALEGPWQVYGPGTLQIEETDFTGHIASPDVHVDSDEKRVRMYFHGCGGDHSGQRTRVALSPDGVRFQTVEGETLGRSYWRVFELDGWYYTLEMPGLFRRSRDPLGPFEEGPMLFTEDMRHSAVKLDNHALTVFWSNAHDVPEHILTCTIDASADWMQWQASEPATALRSELEWEGADKPVVESARGSIHEPVHQLRDPCIYREDEKTYLLYSVAGEHGIAAAEVL